MRNYILIAAFILSASTAHAGSRSLSGPQTAPVDAATYQAQSAKPAAAETTPVQVAPPEATPVAAKPVEPKPAPASAAPEARPVKQAQHKPKRRTMTVEQRMHREFINIEQAIGYAYAIAGAFYW